MINFTESAANRIAELIAKEGNPNLKLRMFIQGGGCAGFSYGFTLDEVQSEDDFSYVTDDVTLLVDSTSMQYLDGATVRWEETMTSAAFVIDNPHSTTTCGCGSSFAV